MRGRTCESLLHYIATTFLIYPIAITCVAGIIFNSGGIFFFLLGFVFPDACSNLWTLLTGLRLSDSPSVEPSVMASDVRSIVALET